MRLLLISCLLMLLQLVSLADTVRPEDLKNGGYILYFRHTKADVGKDCKNPSLPDWWQSTESKLTRQLSTEGAHQARVIGQTFRNLSIPVGHLLCSEFRRTQDTAKYMGIGEFEPEGKLTPLVHPGNFSQRLWSVLEQKPVKGTNTVVVAHGHVLPVFENLDEGSTLVFQPGETEPVGTISYDDWKADAGPLVLQSLNPKDRISYSNKMITIRSATGIGHLTTYPVAQDEWPAIDRVRFEYSDGGGMGRIEGLWVVTSRGEPQERKLKPKRETRGKAIEIELPKMLKSDSSLYIHWVDVYR